MLDMQDVMPILLARGYGVHRNRQYELQLTVAGKRQFKTTGAYERECLKGISRAEVEAVLQKAETFEEAANLFELMSKGEVVSLVEEVSGSTASTGLTAEQIASIIDSRVANRVREELAPLHSQLADFRTEMGALVEKCQDLLAAKKAPVEEPVKRGRGRPKGSKNKRSKEEVDRMVAELGIPTAPPQE